MEIWKSVKGYEGLYEVSDKGNVKSLERVVYYDSSSTSKTDRHTVKEKIKNASDNGKGYKTVNLYKKNKMKICYVHRLVAEAFLYNPDNKETVNHKNFDKSDNRVENLEWATYGENNKHSRDFGGARKPVLQERIVAVKDGVETFIDNILEWCKTNKHDRSAVYKCLAGQKLTHHGYKFRKETEELNERERVFKTGKLAKVIFEDGTEQVLYEGISKFAKENGIPLSMISCVLNGRRKTCKGMKFKYV